jgi:actin related protein 2/3 complex subunit 1A/1B
LAEHDQVVTGIDWTSTPDYNALVSCSQDRNAYVWESDGSGKWNPTLVILRISRAATDVKWSPNAKKFAVSSAAKAVSICYYENENNWWISKHIKKGIKSTVLCVEWHPESYLVATGCSYVFIHIYIYDCVIV